VFWVGRLRLHAKSAQKDRAEIAHKGLP
jgi:hypothetical protein